MTFVLIPGAGCTPYHWHPLTAELRHRGHPVIEVDLPCDDPTAGLTDYVDAVVTAVARADHPPTAPAPRTEAVDTAEAGNHRVPGRGLTVVAHSLGGMTAPLVCERLPVELLVLVAGMIPRPGESMEQWWENTGYRSTEDEGVDTFFHDLPPDLATAARRELRDQSTGPWTEPSPLRAWPDVPTRAVIARDDLLFPADFLRRVTEDRLGFTPDETPGGHFPMLGHPTELADRLEAYQAEVTSPRSP
ncbi:hypothetical protein Kfla_7028 [Kribbella flavida DSM 17836]|uniref:AB hydrolase-1 domain-containing protein n=1 Tax=Kribbella flavida (strain DSM 17836 / JCM 10339 / NBRC 14399) TaxID=479435 RepID=D2Q3Z4_KRIFD|nr:alpha/beta hydrolase [Kribbella flavida]ADB36016.1 hypothetical protein Kfla_7028 [Kribbella flavida DSM 17836]